MEIVQTDAEAANQTRLEIETTIEKVVAGHFLFTTGFARLGNLLFEVREKKYWLEWGFESFGEYVKDVEKKIHKSRSQIYLAISTSKNLLPYTDHESIEKMGITKAAELAKVVQITGQPPTEKMMSLATDPQVEVADFKNEIYEEANIIRNPDEKGKFFDLKGFYCTDEERQEIEAGFELAAKVDPPIPQETSEWQRRKEIIIRLVREFRATYEAEVGFVGEE